MSYPSPAIGPLKGMFQLAYVTSDLDQAAAVFADHYGIPEFGRLGEFQLGDESSGKMTIDVGVAWVDNMQFELIQPIGGEDSLYRDFLRHGSFQIVFHHVGILVPSHEALERQREDSVRRGHKTVLSGGVAGASAFFYADARGTLGHYLEYLFLTPQRLAFHHSMPSF